MVPAIEDKLNDLSKRMEIVSQNYFFARRILSNNMEMSEDNFLILINYMKCVRACYEKLESTQKRFINNEYFYQGYLNWWKKEMTQKEYLVLKIKSIVNFLEDFYASI